MKTYTRITLLVLVLSSSACSTSMPSPFHEGHIQLSADAEGMRAFGDTLNGLITNGKASPDKDTAHWQTRKSQEIQKTKRVYAPGFLQKLLGEETKTAEPSSGISQIPAQPAETSELTS